MQLEAVDELGFDGHPDLVRVATENFTGVAATQICEDLFSHMKNSSAIRAKKKYRRPEKAYGAGLARKVVSRIHRFKEVEVDVMTPVRHIRLPRHAFEAKRQNHSMDWAAVSGVNSKPSWYSPSGTIGGSETPTMQ